MTNKLRTGFGLALVLASALLPFASRAGSASAEQSRWQAEAARVTITRDEWGGYGRW